MFDNLKNWLNRRVIEPSTMAGFALVLAFFFPGEGESLQDAMMDIAKLGPELFAAVMTIAAIVMKEKGDGSDKATG